jgi:hypothetical protein
MFKYENRKFIYVRFMYTVYCHSNLLTTKKNKAQLNYRWQTQGYAKAWGLFFSRSGVIPNY